MEPLNIFIVGAGKLANAIVTSGIAIPSCNILKWETHHQTTTQKAIVVHAGSGRQLKECIDFCDRTKSVFIELSTGLETENMAPTFPLVICPNTSILVLKTLGMIRANGSRFENYQITITESHQSSKTTEPGTAFAFANAMKFPLNKIVSVRDPQVQQHSIGIPSDYLGKHAYHKIVIKDGNDEVTIETKVLGHDSYARGVKSIVEAVVTHNLENKRYTVLDLVDNNML